MRLSSKSIPWAVAAIVVATLVASSLLLGSALRTQRQTDEQIRQHFENVLTLRRTLALLVDAETGQRGYLLTGQPNFLGPYQNAREKLPAELDRLVQAGVDTPGNRLEKLGVAKLNELAQTLALARNGQKDAAMARIAGGLGKRYMDAIRLETARDLDREQVQLNAAIVRSEEYTSRTYWSLAVLLLSAIALVWLGFATLLRTSRLEAEAVRLREVEEAQKRTALVARELNHRVKNLFSIVLAIVQLASRGATTPRETVARIRERVQALARAHEVSLGADPMGGFDLESMLRTILAPYVSDSAELEITGPAIQLPVMRVTPIGLIIHELATNAMKYGAWSADGGKVAVRWSVADAPRMNGAPAAHVLQLRWDETRPEPLAEEGATGFGSKLINAAVAQLDGSVTRERGDHGLRIVIDAPIIPAYSARAESNA